MLEWTPENSSPPPEAAELQFAWLGFDWVWEERDAKAQAHRDFKVNLVEVLLFNRWTRAHVAQLQPCFGALLFDDGRIPFGFAQVCDYFFARDKREALVYVWLPYERRFRLVDQEWVDLRRRPRTYYGS